MGNWLTDHFSQTRAVGDRKARGLHPVNELQRFGLLVCCFFCSICVSLTFAFELLSTQFRSQFNLSPGDMSTVSTIGLIFCYFLIPYSLIYEYLGPALNFALCGATGFIGAVCLGLTFQGKMPGNLATITVFYAFLNTSAGLFDTTYISVLFEVFPRNRGPVIALSKVMTGLGTSILSCLFTTVFDGQIVVFVYFLAAFITIVSVFAALFVALPPYYMNWWRRRGKSAQQRAALQALKPYYSDKFVPKPRLIVGYVVVLCMIVFFAVSAPVLAYSEGVTRGGRMAVGAIAIILTACLVLPAAPLPQLGGMNEPAPVDFTQLAAVDENAIADYAALSDDLPSSSGDADIASKGSLAIADYNLAVAVATCRQDPRYPADTFVDYLKSPELWLLLAYLILAQPMGILISFNSSTVSIALTGVARSGQLSALYSAFLGVGNSLGRIAFGLFEAWVQHQDPANRKVVITAALFVAPVLISVAGILVQVMPGNSILLPYIIVYIQNGFNAALCALVFTSLFDKFHNTLYCVGFLATVICVVVFNRALFGTWVDSQHDRLGLPSSVECNAASCVRVPLIVATVCGALSAAVAVALHIRYSRYARRMRAAATAKAAAQASSAPVVAICAAEPVDE